MHDRIHKMDTDKMSRKRELVKKPKPILDCIEVVDEMTSSIHLLHCCLKGIKKIFFILFVMVPFSACILYKKLTAQKLNYNQLG
jgi:hypothetical protein